jgi:hypothetical protein
VLKDIDCLETRKAKSVFITQHSEVRYHHNYKPPLYWGWSMYCASFYYIVHADNITITTTTTTTLSQ